MSEKGYSTKELLLSAIKSEKLAAQFYAKLAKQSDNPHFKDRLLFLSKEETKHMEKLRKMYEGNFENKKVGAFTLLLTPIHILEAPEKCETLRDCLDKAMEGEKAAEEFYTELAKQFPPESEEVWLLSYFAVMENGHYQLLANEKFFDESHEKRKKIIRKKKWSV